MWPWIRLAYEVVASTLAPNLCASCDAAVPMLCAFCPRCAGTLVPASPSHDTLAPNLVVPYLYGGALAEAIQRFKYGARPDLARHLSAALIPTLRDSAATHDCVAPVPLHPSRLAARGYNQAALLARPVARALGVRFAPRLLRRVVDTSPQVARSRVARRTNVERAFALVSPADASGLRVLLVDDVCTTGATLGACAAALTSAGAAHVACAAVARAP